jgi:hypothetical protein
VTIAARLIARDLDVSHADLHFPSPLFEAKIHVEWIGLKIRHLWCFADAPSIARESYYLGGNPSLWSWMELAHALAAANGSCGECLSQPQVWLVASIARETLSTSSRANARNLSN